MRDIPRVITPLAGFRRNYARLKLQGTAAAKRLGRAIANLARAEHLPAPNDIETVLPPAMRVWVRKVPGAPLWLYYTWSDAALLLRAVKDEPPPRS